MEVKDKDLQEALRKIDWKLSILLIRQRMTMATVDDIIAEVQDTQGTVDSAVTLIGQLHQLLTDALNSGDPAKVQEALDAINAQQSQLADAVANNPAPA